MFQRYRRSARSSSSPSAADANPGDDRAPAAPTTTAVFRILRRVTPRFGISVLRAIPTPRYARNTDRCVAGHSTGSAGRQTPALGMTASRRRLRPEFWRKYEERAPLAGPGKRLTDEFSQRPGLGSRT